MYISDLSFSANQISGYYIKDVHDYLIQNEAVVINISNTKAIVDGDPLSFIPARRSTVLTNAIIKKADALIVIWINNINNLGGLILNRGWESAETIFGEDFTGVPLWRSPQVKIDEIQIDLSEYSMGDVNESALYDIIVNMWYATEKTHCKIHNEHTFIEYHTQIYGIGRMQKFKTPSYDSLYEEVVLAKGVTHDIFCNVETPESFLYPWHQYFSNTDCIWFVTELHPK